MSEINYEDAVKRVYPDAKVNGDMNMVNYDIFFWIENGQGDWISDEYMYAEDAWRNAYHTLKEKGGGIC